MWPDRDCGLCPRLAAYRLANRQDQPLWHNAPALPFGRDDARLLIVGLAPGRTGANRTGRVFTGDASGRALFDALLDTGWATGQYSDDGRDDLRLNGCRISNAVLCAPPGNRPLSDEQTACRPYLKATIAAMRQLEVIVTLGDVARHNVLKALGLSQGVMAPGHGSEAFVAGLTLINTYHCSRLNMNTGRLTPGMLSDIFIRARTFLKATG
ncbi:MAG: uracil-DNA glycosylase [Asticcacaulis sp.]|nr:uracil-DNA glycosylase [Asticcacaulis sp.]